MCTEEQDEAYELENVEVKSDKGAMVPHFKNGISVVLFRPDE